MDVVKITEALHGKINATLSTEEVLILTKALEKLKLGNVKTVTAYADLLDLYPLGGEIYFVENEEKLYYGFGNYWYSIFDTTTPIAYAWGSNTSGRLGDNTLITESKSSPVTVVGGLTDWVQLSAGSTHSLGIRANGTLWAWGYGTLGRLGHNETTNKSSPVLVTGGFTDWVQAEATNFHSIGIRANGTMWAWGNSTYGVLGNNTIIGRSSPTSVVGGITDWIQASLRDRHALAVRANGTLYSWGNNGDGKLGDNISLTTVNRSSPFLVAGGITDWIQASAGGNHSLAVRTNGTMYAWGNNGYGQLGRNTPAAASTSSPVLVAGGFTNWTQAATASQHSLGLRADGTLYAWGFANSGRIGDGTTVDKSSPVLVAGGITNWTQASAGLNQSLAIRATGQLYTWGNGNTGRLGDGTIANKSSPVLVAGGFTDWVQASTGNEHALGLRIQ